MIRDAHVQREGKETHVGLDVEVLEVEGVLPDIDADDGKQVQKRVLVSRRRDLELLGRWVQALSLKDAESENDVHHFFIL